MEAQSLDALTTPVVLFFLLGCGAALLKSSLTVPEALAKGLTIYLMMAIGLKGGVEVATQGLTLQAASAGALGIAFSFLAPIPVYLLLKTFGKLGNRDAGAVSAHYGSVSVVTFVTGAEYLGGIGMAPAGFMVAVLALMETPAIITGLLLARRGSSSKPGPLSGLMHEAFLNGAVVLLVGSFVIGLLVGKEGFSTVAPVFETGFRGALCIFLLDMGLLAVRRLRETRSLTWRLVLLGIGFPVALGFAGVTAATLAGLDPGSAAAFGILAGSASYIAVPAAMRMALPDADAGLYIGMSLGVTFPFNVLLGISLYSFIASGLAGA